jgi:hypothetical protein
MPLFMNLFAIIGLLGMTANLELDIILKSQSARSRRTG